MPIYPLNWNTYSLRIHIYALKVTEKNYVQPTSIRVQSTQLPIYHLETGFTYSLRIHIYALENTVILRLLCTSFMLPPIQFVVTDAPRCADF